MSNRERKDIYALLDCLGAVIPDNDGAMPGSETKFKSAFTETEQNKIKKAILSIITQSTEQNVK